MIFSFTTRPLSCLFIVAFEIRNLHWDPSNPFKKKISVQVTVVLKCRTSGLRVYYEFPEPGHFIVRYDFGAKAVQFCRVILTCALIFGVFIWCFANVSVDFLPYNLVFFQTPKHLQLNRSDRASFPLSPINLFPSNFAVWFHSITSSIIYMVAPPASSKIRTVLG